MSMEHDRREFVLELMNKAFSEEKDALIRHDILAAYEAGYYSGQLAANRKWLDKQHNESKAKHILEAEVTEMHSKYNVPKVTVEWVPDQEFGSVDFGYGEFKARVREYAVSDNNVSVR